MALTKHQKLLRGIKSLLTKLDIHHKKVASLLDALQFHFYESHWIIRGPQISERNLVAMMYTHLCGLQHFAPNEELRKAARESPLIGFHLAPRFYPLSRVLLKPQDAQKGDKLCIPWGVKLVLPSESLIKLSEAKLEDLLCCSSEDGLCNPIYWFEKEDIANTITNLIFAINAHPHEQAVFEKNLKQPAFDFFYTAATNYNKKDPGSNVFHSEFAPIEESTVAEAYKLLSKSIQHQKDKSVTTFQALWRDQLMHLIFVNLNWPMIRKQAILEEMFSLKSLHNAKEIPTVRWETGRSLDRQTYGLFIRHFAERFLEKKNPTDGEIALLLWVMAHISRDPNHLFSISRILELTTAAIADESIHIDGHEIEISQGLANLLKEYAGGAKSERQKKLFPNLNPDKVPDYFHDASSELLPPNSIPALPEAFLTFPHADKHQRMLPQMRLRQQKHPLTIYHNLISRNELKRQLIEKSKPKIP